MYRIMEKCIVASLVMCPIWWRRGIRHKMKERGRATAKEKNKCTPRYRPATMHRFIMIFLATIQVYCILTIRYHNIYVQYNYIYTSTNMGNHCLQLVLCTHDFLCQENLRKLRIIRKRNRSQLDFIHIFSSKGVWGIIRETAICSVIFHSNMYPSCFAMYM